MPPSSPSPAAADTAPPAQLSNRLGLGLMRLLARLPLSWVRALGWALGSVLHVLATRRRRIARWSRSRWIVK